jgi:general stress protein 26
MSELKQKILSKFQGPTLSALSTIMEDGKPWVRYVTPFADENLTFWMATFIHSRKVDQIRNNPEVHITTGVVDPQTADYYLQIQGRAEVLTDEETKKRVWFDELNGIFSGPGDPNYCVCKITPYRVEIQEMGMNPPEVLEL